MAEKQITFKGFPLDSRGDVVGAFPSVDVIQERSKDLINGVVRNINQMTIDYCLKFNIDPDVLIKQKAEIELLKTKIEKMKCCGNCRFPESEEEFNECEERERQIHEEKVKEHYEHKCENCRHYNHRDPPPFCLICKTGFNDDFRKRDYWEELTY